MAHTLEQFLEKNGFHRIANQNVVLKRETTEEIELIQITRMNQDCYATPKDYIRKNQQLILEQAEQGKKIRILNLIFVYNLNCLGVKEVAEQVPDVWIFNESKKRLVLFENQTRDFGGIYDRMEQWIQEGEYEAEKEGERDFKKCPITMILFLSNLLIYFIVSRMGDVYNTAFMLKMGANNWRLVFEQHEYYRLFTCMFLHFGISHLANNMTVFLLAGEQLEKELGKIKYMLLYFGSGLIASLISITANAIMQENVVSAGASGAIYGLIGAIIIRILFDKEQRKQFSFGRGILLIIGTIYLNIQDTSVDQFAHGGGFIAGVIIGACFFFFEKKKKLAQEKIFD